LFGPQGDFVVVEENGEERLVFLAEGSGIAPFKSMILDQLITKKSEKEMVLYWGMKTASQMFWEEDFYQLADEYKNFSWEMILSEPPSGWKLSEGRVEDLVKGYEKKNSDTGYYVCGSQKMIDKVSGFLQALEVNETMIHKLKFY
jgi:Na+-transporting NADH:ubiquinone oxidoreductase subunit F